MNYANYVMEEKLVAQPNNPDKQIDNHRKMYESQCDYGWIHAFQKDAIQNSMGARVQRDYTGFSVEIFIEETNQGTFVIVEDHGTHGLTGPNLDREEIEKLQKSGDLKSNLRLARFSSSNNSGDIDLGGGLFGIGKSVYAMASTTKTYFFDSLCDDGYRANIFRAGYLYGRAEEGVQAQEFIKNNTGLDILESSGTRIVICEPDPDLLTAIEDGTLIRYVEETWWRAIVMFPNSAHIIINSIEANKPKALNNNNIIQMDQLEKPYRLDSYTVKRIGLFIVRQCEVDESGFYFYRRGMRIGKINIQSVPKKLNNDFIGYIEIDETWESELSNIEGTAHYDVTHGGKHTKVYSVLRNAVNEYFTDMMEQWGYSSTENYEDKKLNRQIHEIKARLEDLFDNLGYDDLGKGTRKKKLHIRWKKILYPEKDTKSVYENGHIHLEFELTNEYKSHNKIILSSSIINYFQQETLNSRETISLEPNQVFSGSIDFDLTDSNSTKYEKNRIQVVVTPTRGDKIIKKFDYFYFADTPEVTKRDFNLSLHDILLPRKTSKRVNTGESIENVVYTISNNTSSPVSLMLSVSTHNMEMNGNEIEGIMRQTLKLEPGEDKNIETGPILLERDVYENHLTKGIVQLRARLIANSTIGSIQKGDRLATYKYQIYFNRNEKKGIQDTFEPYPLKQPEDPRRSWTGGAGENRMIYLNVSHPAYSLSKDNGTTESYIFEQMLIQFVNLYIREGNYSVLETDKDEFLNRDPYQQYELILKSIDTLLFRSLGGNHASN